MSVELWDLGKFVTTCLSDERHSLEAWEEEGVDAAIAIRTVVRSETGGLWEAGPTVYLGAEELQRLQIYERKCRQNYYRRMTT